MGAIASQITSLTMVCSTVYSDVDKRKQQSSASLAFVRGIHRAQMASNTQIFPFDDVIMLYRYTLAKSGLICHGYDCLGYKSWWRHQNGNIFRVTGPLCGNPPVPSEFPAQRPVTQSEAGDLRRHRAHYDVIVMWRVEWGRQMACNDKEKNNNIILFFGYGDMTNDGYRFHSPFMINIRAISTMNQLRNKILRICLANYLLTNCARHKAVA